MKKKLCLILAIVLALALAACGSSESVAATETPASEVSGNTPSAEQAEPDTETKVAVVYFSATGNTEEVAEIIAAQAGADIFEIVPETEYTSEDLNYTDDSCRANQEMEDDSARPAISSDLSAVEEYDVIFLGHPIWWGTAPRIIQTFLESYDLSGATIYTFCTSGGSGIDRSVSDLQSLYPELNIVSGRRFSGSLEESVEAWLGELELE